MNNENRITVVIPVKNEAANLAKCIAQVAPLGTVIVVDSGSTDGTQQVAVTAGAEVLQFEWNGQFPKKRNWTLRNHHFRTEWVLFLDADEFVTEEFIEEVRSVILNTKHVGFRLHYSNYFMGSELKYGDRMCKLALFRLNAGEYERIEEDAWSHLDMEIHEHPVLDGSIGDIHAQIEHNDFRGLKHYIAKHNEYASWEAARYLRLRAAGSREQGVGSREQGVGSREQGVGSRELGVGSRELGAGGRELGAGGRELATEWDGLTYRQKKKYRNLAKWWFAPAYFIATYFLKKGFLDGSVGLHFALMKAVYFYQIRLKILEAS